MMLCMCKKREIKQINFFHKTQSAMKYRKLLAA